MPDRQSWYSINAENAAKSGATPATRGAADVYLYDGIGMFGVSAASFLDALLGIDAKSINLHLNSPGGMVDDGIAIYNALKEHPATVNVIVDGLAASIASVIAQAGDKRVMAAGSTMMIHDPFLAIDATVRGDAGDMRNLAAEAEKAAVYLDKLGENVAEIYAARAGGAEAEWRDRMKATTWYRPREAVAAGLADAVVPSKGAMNSFARAFDLAALGFKNVPEWAKNGPQPAPRAAPEPADTDHGWQFLAHHDATGGVDPALLRTAMARVRDLSIPVSDREKALHHLNGHAKVAAIAA